MASTSAALNRALLAAVCVVLLHSSLGQQPTPASHCSPHNGKHPAPTPAPAPAPMMPPPAPMPTPTPSPSPAPVVDCHNLCTSNCNYNCTATRDAGLSKCEADFVADFNGCYDDCTSKRCPGKSCEHSGCGFRNCTCENPNAVYCCQGCASAVSSAYSTCRLSYQGYVYNCMQSCTSDCNNKCP